MSILRILVSIVFFITFLNIVYTRTDLTDRHSDKGRKIIDLSRIASEKYLQDSMEWIAEQNLKGKGRKEFKHLWRSYKEDRKHGWSQFIAKPGRTWVYDNAVGIYALLKFSKLTETRGEKEESVKHLKKAGKAIDSLIKLNQWEEKRGYQGLWHFCYDTRSSYISPMGAMGANLWVLNAIYAYIIQSKDRTYLKWINDRMKTFIFKQQVMEKDDPRYGLIQAGLRSVKGDRNSQMTWCNIEHNIEYIGTLRLAARVNHTGDKKFLFELAKRHELCVKAILKNFWRKDHFCTLITETGEINELVSADTTSWTPFVLLPYMEINDIWKCIQYLKDNFRIETEEGEQCYQWHWKKFPNGRRKIIIKNKKVPFNKKIAGLFFFTREHGENLSLEEKEKLEKMLHPEAMAFAGLFLLRYVQQTEDKEKRKEALELLIELYNSLIAVKKAYGGKGTPYATLNVEDFSNTLESMTSTAAGAILTMALLGVDMDDFLGIVPPESFTVNNKKPYTR